MTKTKPLILLTSLDAVDAVLGGTVATARIAGKSAASISNAKRRGSYPKDTHAVMQAHLANLGYCASAHLWGQVEPANSKEVA